MMNFFRMLFDWSNVQQERDHVDEMVAAATQQHEVAANSLKDLLLDMQRHGAIIEKPTLPVENVYKLHS